MKAWLEAAGWAALLAVLSALVLGAGARRADLERRVPVDPAELYRTLARSQTSWQVIDARPDVVEQYEDAHVPGALPMPACDLARAPEAARQRIHRGVPTVVVTAAGDPEEVRRCLASFTAARSLAGGMEAWSDANLPEDSGEYSAPSARAGGGCL
jgi:rhodanese-related sulfurtransferase